MKPPTPRELDVLGLLSVGYTIGDAAAELSITEKTVRTHVQSAMRHLQVHTRTHAVALCIRQGWI